jgi:hypothetical protein
MTVAAAGTAAAPSPAGPGSNLLFGWRQQQGRDRVKRENQHAHHHTSERARAAEHHVRRTLCGCA